jgi:hypothetical protein
MASPAAVALLDQHSHRMPMRADQIRAIAHALGTLRSTLGDDAARSTPHYGALLRLLRAHARPMPYADVSFAQVQAVRLQMLAVRLLEESKPFPPQLSAAIRQGLVAGFDPKTGLAIPREQQQKILEEQYVQDQAEEQAARDRAVAEMTASRATEAEPGPWAERRIPVRRVNMSIVKPNSVDAALISGERERALRYRMSVTAEDIAKLLSDHERAVDAMASQQQQKREKELLRQQEVGAAKLSTIGSALAILDPRTAALLEARQRHVRLIGLQRVMRQNLLDENARAEREGRRGSKQRVRVLRQLQKEHEKLDRARSRREEAEDRDSRKRKQAWMNALTDHSDRFRRYHRDVVRRGMRATVKNITKYHDEMRHAQTVTRSVHVFRSSKTTMRRAISSWCAKQRIRDFSNCSTRQTTI